jgi:non-ribosomal peptide synthetase component F
LPFNYSSACPLKPRTNAKLYSLDDNLRGRVQKLSIELSCSVFDIFKTIWALLISIYSDQDKVVITYPFNTRRGEHKSVKGAFLNSCLYFFERKSSFRHCILNQKTPKRDIIQNYANIIDILSHVKGISPSCAISQTDLIIKGPILESTPGYQFSIELGSADLCLFLNTSEACWKFGIVATQNLFDHTMLDQLFQHFCNLLIAVTCDPDCDLVKLSCLDSDEYNTLVYKWSQFPDNQASTSRLPQNIVEAFEDQVAKNPNQTAIIYRSINITYQELNERANKVARALFLRLYGIADTSLSEDILIPVYIPHGVEFVVALLAVLKVGAAYIPIDPSHPKYRINLILGEINAPLILTKTSLVSSLKAINPNATYLCIDDEEILSHNTTNLNQPIKPLQLAYIMYTSGTKGSPKGVMIDHKMWYLWLEKLIIFTLIRLIL